MMNRRYNAMPTVVQSAAVIGLVLAAGCADSNKPTTQPADIRSRQEAALQDPFSYKVDMGANDINGGDLSHFDSKGMKHDADSVFNP